MFSCYFLRIIRQSIQVLCPVFSRKVFFRGVEGSNKGWTSKTSLSASRQDFVEHGGWVISAAKQPEILHVPLVATNDLLSESPNSIFGTSFFLRETTNSLPGTNKLAFTESGMRLFCISLKTNRTPVTQELYLDEKTMPNVYVIVSRIYGSYTRSYILMRKQCIMSMLLLAASTADYFCTSWTANRTPLTQGLISWWENSASCLCYCWPHLSALRKIHWK